MKKLALLTLLIMALTSTVGCTNMSKTNQGALSGAAIGTVGGLGIAAISGGAAGWAAVTGAVIGGVAGGVVGHQQERQW